MQEFEIKKLTMQAKIGTQKGVEITTPRTRKYKHFDPLKLLNRYNSANADIFMFLTLYEGQVSRMKMSKQVWASYLLILLSLEITSIITRRKSDISNYEYIKKILLKKFNISPKKFKQIFLTHRKEPMNKWCDLDFHLRNML